VIGAVLFMKSKIKHILITRPVSVLYNVEHIICFENISDGIKIYFVNDRTTVIAQEKSSHEREGIIKKISDFMISKESRLEL
jgi:hypothetical protein